MPLTAPEDLPVVHLRRELIARGYDDRWIRRRMADGTFSRARFGAYVDRGAWDALSVEDRHRVLARAVAKTLERPAVFSHTTAAIELGAPAWGLDLSTVHLTMTDGGGVQRCQAGVRQHRGRIVDGDVWRPADLSLVRPARAAVEVTAIASVPAALSVVCHLLHARVTTRDEVLEAASRMDRWPGMLASHVVPRLADAAVSSVLEARFLHFCFVNGVTMPQLQHEVRLPDGSVAYLDFWWPGLGVWVEVDGKEKYLKHRRPGESVADAVVREKKREDAIRLVTGWRCLRLTWADLENPRRLLAVLLDFLTAHRAG